MTLTPRSTQASKTTGFWLAMAIVAGHLAAAIGLNYPGHLSVDSIVQLGEARSGVYASFHPPFTTWLLGVSDLIITGTGFSIILNAVIHAASFVWLLRLLPRVSWPSIIVLTAWAVWPITLIYDGIVWKDVLFANLTVLGASAALAYTQNPKWHKLLVVVVISAVLLLVRQHGLIISILLCSSVCISIKQQNILYLSAIKQILLAVALIAVTIILSQLVLYAILAGIKSPPARGMSSGLILLMIYDIAGMITNAASADAVNLALFAEAKVNVPKLLLELRSTYAPARIDSLTPFALWNIVPSYPDIFPLVLKQWWQLLLSDPWAYIVHRSTVFTWALGLRDQLQCLPIHLGIVPEPKVLIDALALTQGVSPYSHRLYLYAFPAVNTPVFAPASYCAVIALTMLSLARQWREHVAALAFGAGCLLFCAAYWVIGLACDFRYMYVAVPAAFWLLIYRFSLKPS